MALFENFPYTNFHELNLDWIIKVVKEFLDKYTNMEEEIQKRILKPEDNPNGNAGDFLVSKGDGNTEWKNILPVWEEYVQIAVNEWLNEHPEATTTVEDGSLTIEKFADSLKEITVNHYVTPQMFGGKGDGEHDDTDSIIAAIDYLNEINGGMLLFPTGTYLVTDSIPLSGKTNIIFAGTSKNSSVIKWNKEQTIVAFSKDLAILNDYESLKTKAIFYNIEPWTENQYLGFVNLTFDGDNNIECGLYLKWLHRDSFVQNCHIINCIDAGMCLDRSWCFSVYQTTIENAITGMALMSGSNDITVYDCSFFYNKFGIELIGDTSSNGGSAQVRIDSCIFEHEEVPVLFTSDDERITVVSIEKCYFENNPCCGYFRTLNYSYTSFRVINFDKNTAVCDFNIPLTKNDTPYYNDTYLDFRDGRARFVNVRENSFKTGNAIVMRTSANCSNFICEDNDVENANNTPYFDTVPNYSVIRSGNEFLTPLNMGYHIIENLGIMHRQPSKDVEGTIYYDSTAQEMRYYDGYQWVSVEGFGIRSKVIGENIPTTAAAMLVNKPYGVGLYKVSCTVIATNADIVNIRVIYQITGGANVIRTIHNGAIEAGATSFETFAIYARGYGSNKIELFANAGTADNVKIYASIEPC